MNMVVWNDWVMLAYPDNRDFEGWVAKLGDPPRSKRAYWHLVLSGVDALPEIRAGLASENADVRRYCTRALDHLVDETSFPQLIERLADSEPAVRVEALHALACDRCKETMCRPNPNEVLGRSIELVLTDPDQHVRAAACELVGKWVHTHPNASNALVRTARNDPSPAVRKKASWYAPGGTIYRKTEPSSVAG
jgi:HEAT repeats